MPKTYLSNLTVIGPKSEMGQRADSGATEAPFGLYLCSDTGELYQGTGNDFVKIGQLDAPPYLGVSGDGDNGLTVTGDIIARSLAVGDGASDGTVAIKLKAGQTLLPFSIVNSNDQTKFSIAVDGETVTADDIYSAGWVKAAEAVSAWGVTGPAVQPLLATGVNATVDDVIALLQSYGLCKQS